MTHVCPLRGQSVWDRTVCGFCFFLAGMEPQDMISWHNSTNNLPGFINNYILQRDNVRIDENPLKPERGRSSKLAHKYHCDFLLQLDLLYFISITALSKGNMPMNSWTTKQTLWLCWYATVGQICQWKSKSDDEHLTLVWKYACSQSVVSYNLDIEHNLHISLVRVRTWLMRSTQWPNTLQNLLASKNNFVNVLP